MTYTRVMAVEMEDINGLKSYEMEFIRSGDLLSMDSEKERRVKSDSRFNSLCLYIIVNHSFLATLFFFFLLNIMVYHFPLCSKHYHYPK